MLWDSSGVGKSQGVHEIAKDIEKRTGPVIPTTVGRMTFVEDPMVFGSV